MAVHMGGSQSRPSKVADFVTSSILSFARWFAAASLLALSALIAVVRFNQDDLGTALVLFALLIAAYGMLRAFPVLTAGIAAIVLIKKRHAITTVMMASVLFSLFAIRVDWMDAFSYAVIVSSAYWLLVMAMILKHKPWHMILFMFILLGIVIKGAAELLGGHSVALPALATEHPVWVGVAVLAVLIFVLDRRSSAKDKADLAAYLERKKAEDEYTLECMKEDERRGRPMTDVEKEIRRRKDIEMDAGPPPKLYMRKISGLF